VHAARCISHGALRLRRAGGRKGVCAESAPVVLTIHLVHTCKTRSLGGACSATEPAAGGGKQVLCSIYSACRVSAPTECHSAAFFAAKTSRPLC